MVGYEGLMGIGQGLSSTAGNSGSWGSSTGTTTDGQYLAQLYIAQQDRILAARLTPDGLPLIDNTRVVNFFRGNKAVRITKKDLENGKFEEPLDELRIEVAKWLN